MGKCSFGDGIFDLFDFLFAEIRFQVLIEVFMSGAFHDVGINMIFLVEVVERSSGSIGCLSAGFVCRQRKSDGFHDRLCNNTGRVLFEWVTSMVVGSGHDNRRPPDGRMNIQP